MESIIKRIEEQIAGFTPAGVDESVGIVRETGDGIAEIDGLDGAVMSEMVLFDPTFDRSLEDALKDAKSVYGLVLNLEEDGVRAVILGEASDVFEGMQVRRLNRLLSIPVGESLIGRVLNPLGEPVDDKSPLANTELKPIEREAYGVIDRAPVNVPLHTGVKAVDAMIPIGRGQRELIIGDRGTGKTAIAIDTILNQKSEPVETRPICIYVAIGQKESKTARIVAELTSAGAMDYTIVVTAPASSPAALPILGTLCRRNHWRVLHGYWTWTHSWYMTTFQSRLLHTVRCHFFFAAHQDAKHTLETSFTCTHDFLSVPQSFQRKREVVL